MAHTMRFGFVHDEELYRRHGPVIGMYEFRRPFLLFASAEAVKAVTIQNFDSFRNRRADLFPPQRETESAVNLLEDESWKRCRSIISPTFSSSKLKQTAVIIQACGRDLAAAFQAVDGAEVDIRTFVSRYTVDVIGRTLFGIEANCQQQLNHPFVTNCKLAFRDFDMTSPLVMATQLLPRTLTRSLCRLFNVGALPRGVLGFFRTTILDILKLREGLPEKPQDFLQLLVEAQELESGGDSCGKVSFLDFTDEAYSQMDSQPPRQRSLSRKEIVANAIMFFMVGYQTTAATMGWMLNLLAHHPRVQERLAKEIRDKMEACNGVIGYDEVSTMQYLDQVFCETLRLYPVAGRIDRSCNSGVEVLGHPIEAGDMVQLSVWAIHRNPEYWPNPERFDPDRFAPGSVVAPCTWLPFGSGPRNCIGMRMAVLEAKIGVAYLLHSWRLWPGPKSQARTEYPSSHING